MTQIGTVKLQTQNSGVVDVPVFETGDSASGVFEFVRVETASGTGFIPVTDPADATYPYLRVQSQNNGIVAVTDTAGDDIPDSVVHQWKFDEGSGATVTDNVGDIDGDISGASWLSNNDGEGGFVLDFDGVDDDITYNTIPPVLDPTGTYTIAITCFTEPSGDEVIWSWDKSNTDGSTSLGPRDGDLAWGERNNSQRVDLNDLPTPPFRVQGINDNNSFKLYIDASDNNSFDGSGAFESSGGDVMAIGRLQDRQDFFYDGELDNPIIYDDVLTESELQDDLEMQPWA